MPNLNIMKFLNNSHFDKMAWSYKTVLYELDLQTLFETFDKV
jgi:hypothetical protein